MSFSGFNQYVMPDAGVGGGSSMFMPEAPSFTDGGQTGNNFLGSVGSSFLKGLSGSVDNLFGGSGSESSGRYGTSRGSYTDDTKRLMQAMLLQSMQSFDPSRIRSTIGDV
jgi:hypothetical protein